MVSRRLWADALVAVSLTAASYLGAVLLICGMACRDVPGAALALAPLVGVAGGELFARLLD